MEQNNNLFSLFLHVFIIYVKYIKMDPKKYSTIEVEA